MPSPRVSSRLGAPVALMLIVAAVSCSARVPESPEAGGGDAEAASPASTAAATPAPVAAETPAASPAEIAEAPAPQPEPVVDPNDPVVMALREAAAYAEQQDNATIEMSYKLRLTENGETKERDSRYRVLLGPGHDFAVGPIGGTYGPRTHAGDGKMVILSPEPGGNNERYIVRHGLAAFTTTRAIRFIGNGLGGLTLSLLSPPSSENLIASMKDSEDLGVEEIVVDGQTVACRHGRLTTAELTWDYWIEASDASTGNGPRLRRIVPDLSNDDGDASSTVSLTVDLAWDTETPLPAGAFFTEEPPHPLLGESLPAVALPLLSGQTERLGDLIGKKVIVLDFWATWCPVCIQGMPTLEAVAGEYADRGVVAIAVNVGEDPAELETFVQSQGWTIPIALDQQLTVSEQLQVGQGLPASMIIGLDGRIQVFSQGIPQDPTAFRKKLSEEFDALLAGENLADDRNRRWQAMQNVFGEAG